MASNQSLKKKIFIEEHMENDMIFKKNVLYRKNTKKIKYPGLKH